MLMKMLRRCRPPRAALLIALPLFLLPAAAGMAAEPEAHLAITHGPIVGAVTAHSAKLLVRLDEPAEIYFELDSDPAFTDPIETPRDTSRTAFDYFVIIEASNLAPDTKYYYRPVLSGLAQPDTGSFITFPEAGTVGTFTFAFGGCQQAFGDPNSNLGRVYPVIAAEAPRFFLQIGDWTYPDTTESAAEPQNFFSTDFGRVQSSFHAKYSPAYPMSQLFKVAPIDYVYDDHDYAANNSDGTNPGRNNAIRGYRELFPHYPLANPENGIWHKFTFGNAAFFMLDTRSQRSPNIAAFQEQADGKLAFRPDSTHRILDGFPANGGELQMDWLIRELRASTATWKFICTSVPFNPANSRTIIELALLFQGVPGFDPVHIGGQLIPAAAVAIAAADMWGAFPASSSRLVRAVHDAGIENVILLSGDSHTAAMDDGANSLFPEVMAGGLDRTNSRGIAIAESILLVNWNRGGQTLARDNFNSHFGRITVFGDDSVRAELVDEYGELIAGYTQPAGHLVRTKSLALAPTGQNFGRIKVGSSSVLPLILINTGADTLRVSKLSSSDGQFAPLAFFGASLPPAGSRTVVLRFAPASVGPATGALTIDTDDPLGPIRVLLLGEGFADTATAVTQPADELPAHFALHQNYPNPFNAATVISYELPAAAEVTLQIYDLNGREVRRFHFNLQAAGRHRVAWAGENQALRPIAGGVYFYRLEARPHDSRAPFHATRRLLLLQ